MVASGASTASLGALLTLIPFACAATMAGCFTFLQRLTSRRGRQASPTLECGISLDSSSSYGATNPLQHHRSLACCCSSTAGVTCLHHLQHPADAPGICSPLSDVGSFSSAHSGGSSAYSNGGYYARSSCSGSSTGGAPSPTGHVRSGSESSMADHRAAIQAVSEILLMEHPVSAPPACPWQFGGCRMEGGAAGDGRACATTMHFTHSPSTLPAAL